MTTLTLKINESSKAGKAFMSMADFFIENKTIKVINRSTNEEVFLKEMEVAFDEIKKIELGKLKAKTLKELLNE
jgi:hypothetical protein